MEEKNRINKFIEAVMKVARGDYSAQIKLSGKNDDLDSLAVGINMMIDDIRSEITVHMRAEEELTSSEERLRILFEYAPDAYYLNDLKGIFIDGNKAAENLMGFKRQELIGKSFLKLKLLSLEQIPKAARLLAKNALGKPTGPDEFILKRKDGSRVTAEIRTFPVKIKGKTLVLGIARDITERKKAEEELKVMNEELEAASEELRASNEELEATNEELKSINETLQKREHDLGERVKELNCLYGISNLVSEPGISLEEIFQGIVDIIPPSWQYPEITCARILLNDQEFRTKNFKKTAWNQTSDIIMNSERIGTLEVCYLRKKHEIDEGPFLKEERHLINAVAERVGESIKRKMAEKVQTALYNISEATHSTRNLDELFHSIHKTIAELMYAKNFFIALYNPDDETVSFPYFVDELEESLPPRKKGKGLTEYVIRTGKPLLAPWKVFKELKKKGEVELIGDPWVDWLGVPLKIQDETIGVLTLQSYSESARYSEEDKNILMFVSTQVAMAIERKRTEDAVRESEEKYRTLVESATDYIYTIDKDNKVLSLNKAGAFLFGDKPEKIIGKSIFELFPKEIATRYSDSLKKVFKTNRSSSYESKMVARGKESWLSVSLNPVCDYNGKVVSVMGVGRDITERKKAQEQIKKSLEEKEFLLGEIHHRVKNNMQVISSLLRIQSSNIKDEKILEMFNVIHGRIRSMSLLYEMLYKSRDMARIDLSEYIRGLTTHLFAMYRAKVEPVSLKLNVKDVYLDAQRAIPCGLIITELVSNSLKHAFPNGKKGEISVEMLPDRGKKFSLVIRDTGRGFPEGLDFRKTKSLGMQLVTGLVDQIDGTIKLNRAKGTEFKIVF